MRKKLALAAAGAALLLPLGVGSTTPAKAMTCSPDEPIRTACGAVFGVVGAVCNGRVPTLPKLPVTMAAAVGWPIECPPLG